MTTYDLSGGIPFLLIGGRYVGSTPFIPAALADKSQQQVATALSDPSQAVDARHHRKREPAHRGGLQSHQRSANRALSELGCAGGDEAARLSPGFA